MDAERLKYEIRKNGMTLEEFCDDIGISTSAFYRKLKGSTEFTREEISVIVNRLQIKDPKEIFFPELVS